MGASIAFYTVFSIAPILIIAVGVLQLLVGSGAINTELLVQVRVLFGDAGANVVQALLLGVTHTEASRVATAIGVATLFIGASSVFVELQNSLDRIWGIPPRTRMSGFWQAIRSRFLSIGLVFGVGFLLMVSLLVSILIAAFDLWIAAYLGKWVAALFVVDLILSVAVAAALFALVYKYIPQTRMAWEDVRIGAIVAAVLFNAGKAVMSRYLGTGLLSSAYGAAGSLLVLLSWSYYSAQIFLFGAELTRAYAFIAGSRRETAVSGLPN